MANEKLTSLAKRLRPFIAGQVGAMASSGAFVGEGPGIDVVGFTVGLGGDTILVYNSDGTPVEEFAATLAGLALALAAGGAVVLIDKPCTITGDVTLPAGLELTGRSRTECVIVGKVTLGTVAVLSSLTVANVANGAGDLYGVVGPTLGTGYIFDCDVSATQSGAGNAYAIGAINGASLNNGNIEVARSYLSGTSVGGDGYAARSTRGLIKIWHGKAYGSTARYVKV